MKGSGEKDRILFLQWNRNGGAPRFLSELVASASARIDFETLLSYSRDAEISEDFDSFAGPKLSIRTYRSLVEALWRSPTLVTHAWRLRRFIRANGVTRVVCVMDGLYQSLVVPIAIPRTMHYTFIAHDAELHPGENNVIKRVGRFLEFRRANRVVVLSSSVGDVVRSRLRRSQTLVESVHPVFDVGTTRIEARTLPVHPVVGFFGRLQPYKGLELLVEAERIINTPTVRCEVRVVGQGPESRLKSLGGGVVWRTEWIPEEEVSAVLDQFDLLVVPYTEASQSGVIALALPLGIPIVATPVGGLSQQVLETGGGLVASGVDAEQVARSIEWLLDQPSVYSELSRTALAASEGTYTWARLVSDVVD